MSAHLGFIRTGMLLKSVNKIVTIKLKCFTFLMIRLSSLALSQIIICLISADFKGSCDALNLKSFFRKMTTGVSIHQQPRYRLCMAYLKYISRQFHLDPFYRQPEVTIRNARSGSHKTSVFFENIRRISKIHSPSSIT